MEISKIRILVTRAGEMQGPTIVDLAYVDGIPYAVFEWENKEGSSALQSPSGSTRTHAASSKRKQQSQIPVSSFGRGSQTILLIHLSGSDIQFHLHPAS